MRSSLVTISGLAATLLACNAQHEEPPASPPLPTMNPPPQSGPEEPTPTPAGTLPTWDEVASGHPEGATNPPMPLLTVTADGMRCFKEWRDPRSMAREPEVAAAGGRVLAAGETSEGTEIACPAERVEALLATPAPPPEAP